MECGERGSCVCDVGCVDVLRMYVMWYGCL